MQADGTQVIQMVDNLKTAIGMKCDNTKELMQKSKQSKRALTRQLRLMAQDITEMVTEMLDVEDAKKILYELLQELGWEEGQSIMQMNMSMSMSMAQDMTSI